MKTAPPARIVYIVRLRPEPGMTEEQATRCLRGFLKLSLRMHGLRCISVEPEKQTTENEAAE